MTKPRDLPVGVYPTRSGRYYAYITYRTKRLKHQKHLGTFDTVEEAAQARCVAEQKIKEKSND